MIRICKSVFARHGIPEQVVSDSGTQFESEEWYQFSQQYDFKVITSSPHHHSSNRMAERTVQTVKTLLQKNSEDDLYLALLSYRSTPNESGYSPAELCMGRRLRTRLQAISTIFHPTWISHDNYREHFNKYKKSMEDNFNHSHRAQDAPTLPQGTCVYIPDKNTEGVVKEQLTPRSYLVQAGSQTYWRNVTLLRPIPDVGSPKVPPNCPKSPEKSVRPKRQIRPPEKLNL